MTVMTTRASSIRSHKKENRKAPLLKKNMLQKKLKIRLTAKASRESFAAEIFISLLS